MMYQLIDPFCLFYFKFMHNKGAFLDNIIKTHPDFNTFAGAPSTMSARDTYE